ncbi:hypothetical protein LTR05_004838 [Lithohypha guttulata]|uniref:J domain-containing protein n=1 Tax=Lithohypha guttulata TaxID=1690604 RepID=A0AAN7SZ04_9EURO|nr:hypothetical protein LTR05_004838 [Lithohypha guttulata]
MTSSAPPSGDVDISKIDLYEFLSLPGPQATASEIKRAGRKTSLLYHPDKVAPTPENLQNFHILQIAIGILSDPAEKVKYDQTREAKFRRKAEVDALDARRRKLREDLESRETNGLSETSTAAGQKRTFSEREMKIRRIQEENRRKIEEMKERKRFEAEKVAAQERARSTKEDTVPEVGTPKESNGSPDEHDSMDRSLKLRWIREGEGQAYDENTIGDLMSDVENVILLKDKKRKIDGKKVVMGIAVVVFASIPAAKRAMDGRASIIDKFEMIEWAKAKDEEPA